MAGRSVPVAPHRIPRNTPTDGADIALASAYREWFGLCAQERQEAATRLYVAQGDPEGYLTIPLDPHVDPCPAQACLADIRVLERLCSNPALVYEVTAGAWWVAHGESP